MNIDIGLLFFVIIAVFLLVIGLITWFIERPDLRVTQSKEEKKNNSKTTEQEEKKGTIAEIIADWKTREMRSEMENKQPRYNELAIASLILGLLSFISFILLSLAIASEIFNVRFIPSTFFSLTLLCFLICFLMLTGIASIIIGHVGLHKIKKAPSQIRGRSQARTGLILGYISIIVIMVGIICIAWELSQLSLG